MKKRVVSEGVAKASIYILACLSVVACLWFMRNTHRYTVSAAQPAGLLLGAPATLARADLQPAAAEGPGALSAAVPIAPYTLATPDPVWPTAPLIPAEGGEEPALDEAALVAEMERVAALGVGLPDTVVPSYSGVYHNTAYCCEVYPHICGGNGVTASGTVPTPGLTAAADWNVLPPGTWLYIQDVGIRRVEDSGSAIKRMRLDIAVDTHQNALRWWGFGAHHVWVLAWPE